MKTNLIKAITIHSAYGVEVVNNNGTVWKIDPTINGYNNATKTVGIADCIYDIQYKNAKLLLHSLDKLTQEIDGKIHKKTIEENELYYSSQLPFNNWKKIDYEIIKKCPNWFIEDLLANHYNVFGLSSEYFKEKAF